MNDDTVRAIIIGVVLGTIGLICCIMFMVMLAERKKRKKPRPDDRLSAPAKTELYQKKSTQTKLTSLASPTNPLRPGSSSRTQVL